jgi:hypothetical protein
MYLAFLKWLLVLALLTVGAFYLAVGLGVAIPIVEYKGMQAHNLPAGAALLVVGLLLAIFWRVKIKRTFETSDVTWTISGDRETSKTYREIKTTSTADMTVCALESHDYIQGKQI